jgi:ATP-dependent helicase/nuclease subunit A
MSARPILIPSEQTKAAQRRAADPAISAFVSANAGSGKTTVLVNRVLRLLLAGVPPSRIICLTYTEAAAANMQIRLFRELSQWATMPQEKLEARLLDLLGQPPDGKALARARTLFAGTLETPGGLAINTIHGFCARVLQSAPFEADVPAGFNVIQGAELDALMKEAARSTLLAAAASPRSRLGKAMARIAEDAEETRFAEVIEAMIGEAAMLRGEDGAPLTLDRMSQRLADALAIDTGLTPAAIIAEFRARELSPERLDRIIDGLSSSSLELETANKAVFAALRQSPESADVVAMLVPVFLTGGKRRAKFVNKTPARANPWLADELDALYGAFEPIRNTLLALAAHERSLALATVAHNILARVEAGKRRQRALDFNDIITRTQALFSRISSAWVLYKLDAGIDHVLVDEAQDTSAAQWDIIRRLTGEFFAGAGARGSGSGPGPGRTMFAVGDVKQSIYSFQKAEPAAFEESRRHFEAQARAAAEAGHRFERITLTQSFRSTREIMAGVDLIFEDAARHQGLVFDGASRPELHETARQDGVGAIDLWPIEIDDPKPERKAFDEAPVDAPSSAQEKLARRIAAVLERWTRQKHDDLGRPFRPGDVLILMRRRNALFNLIVRELKRVRVPVAGTDRLDLATHVAVDDIVAIGRAALLPEDDLRLATALKTPILGLDDDDLIRLAPERTGSLRAAIAASPRDAALDARLSLMEKRATTLGPFGFFARLLGPEGGRHAMLSRLGPEAGDALDAVLTAALEHEERHGPSFPAFLESLSSAQEIKRDLAEDAGEVRVMTVHGAKGLEAPLVIIPDIGAPLSQTGRTALQTCEATEGNMPVATPVWIPKKEQHSPRSLAARQAFDAAQEEERRRLFYVALTRARDRLILCGSMAKGEPKPESWYGMARDGLMPHLADAPHPDGGESPILRFRLSEEAASGSADEDRAAPEPAAPVLPEWLTRAAPAAPEPQRPVAPSDIAENRRGQDSLRQDSLRHDSVRIAAGNLAHRLLQHLPNVPEAARAQTAAVVARLHGGALPQAMREGIVANVAALMADPALRGLFGPGSIAEAGVGGEITLKDGRTMPVAGRIDRLLVTPDEVLIVDFKSGRKPAGPVGVHSQALAQIAAYRRLISEVYPGRRVRAAIITLADGAMAEPDAATLDAALDAIEAI